MNAGNVVMRSCFTGIVMLAGLALALPVAAAAGPPEPDKRPQSQLAFCRLLSDFAARYEPLNKAYIEEKNDIARERIGAQTTDMRTQRDKQLNDLLGPDFAVEKWQVKIDEISTTSKTLSSETGSQKFVALKIDPHCDIPVQIWGEETLLTPELANDLAVRKVGEEVFISGTFRKILATPSTPEEWPGRGLTYNVFELYAMTKPSMSFDPWQVAPLR